MTIQDDIDSLIKEIKNNDTDVDSMLSGKKDSRQNDQLENNNYEKEIINNLFPASDKKVVDRLDEITEESEAKVNIIFEKLEHVVDNLEIENKQLKHLQPYIDDHLAFMEVFAERFPNSKIKQNFDNVKEIFNVFKNVMELNKISHDTLYSAMDDMQFQDITRQKIERVISIIRSLHEYLNNVFSSSSEKPRARVASTIVNDKNKKSVDDEVEKIIKELKGGKS